MPSKTYIFFGDLTTVQVESSGPKTVVSTVNANQMLKLLGRRWRYIGGNRFERLPRSERRSAK